MRRPGLTGLLLLAACGGDGALLASDVVVTPPLPVTGMAAAYLTLTNTGNEPVRITRVSSPEFEQASLHQTMLDGGVSRMRPIGEILVPANGSVTLAPGGSHLMLKQAVVPATERQTITLNFYDNDTLLLSVTSGTGN